MGPWDKLLVPFSVRTLVLLQNQAGPKKGKWTVYGMVREALEGNSYTIQFDGSRRLTKQKKDFLRSIVLFNGGPLTVSGDGSNNQEPEDTKRSQPVK